MFQGTDKKERYFNGYIQLKPHLYGCHIMKNKVDMPSSKGQKGYGQAHHHRSIHDLNIINCISLCHYI